MRQWLRWSLLLVCLVPALAWGVSPQTWVQGAAQTYITTNTALTNNSLVLSETFSASPAGYMFADCELNIASTSGTVTAGTTVLGWFKRSVDGTTFEDGSTTVTPRRNPDMSFPLDAVNTAQRIIRSDIRMPPGSFQLLIKNDGTGVSLQGTPWTVKCTLYTPQY